MSSTATAFLRLSQNTLRNNIDILGSQKDPQVSIMSSYNTIFSHSMGLLLAVLKVTINMMHKLATVVGEMLSCESNDIHELNWPEELKESTSLERSKWTGKQLSDLETSCERLLVEGTMHKKI